MEMIKVSTKSAGAAAAVVAAMKLWTYVAKQLYNF